MLEDYIFFFKLKYLKFMHLRKEFVPCQHLQTVRDIFASHLQMPALQENVDTVSLLPELNFENLNSIFIIWSGLFFQTYHFFTFLFLYVNLDEEKILFNRYSCVPEICDLEKLRKII